MARKEQFDELRKDGSDDKRRTWSKREPDLAAQSPCDNFPTSWSLDITSFVLMMTRSCHFLFIA
jgi:hypothetical protein